MAVRPGRDVPRTWRPTGPESPGFSRPSAPLAAGGRAVPLGLSNLSTPPTPALRDDHEPDRSAGTVPGASFGYNRGNAGIVPVLLRPPPGNGPEMPFAPPII